jgi:hypothetical protein
MTCDRCDTEVVAARVFRGGRSGASSGVFLIALAALIVFGLRRKPAWRRANCRAIVSSVPDPELSR